MELEAGILNDSDVLAIILSGVFSGEGPERVYCDNLRRQIGDIFYETREHSLFEGRYHFMTAGAFPYSRDISEAFQTLTLGSSHLGWITGGPDFLERNLLKLAEYIREKKRVHSEDYEFLRSLGGRIEVRENF